MRRACAALLTLLLAAPLVQAGSTPPRFTYRTLDSGKIHVHFHLEVEGPARRVMALALEILPELEARYSVIVPSLDVVVEDANDSPNGLANSFPYPLVEIRTAAPDGADSGPFDSWMRTVVTHELTHIVHIEQARGIYRFGRKVFGRAPFLFPDALQPTWFIEGLAVREETRGTAFGRGRHVYTQMVVDAAARDGQLKKLDQATLGLDIWPFGNAPYLFGEEFLAWLERYRNEGAPRDVAIAHASALRPYRDDRTFRAVTESSLPSLWSRFAAERAAIASAREPQAPGEMKRLTTRSTVQVAPRLSPDGETLAYSSRTLDRLGEIRLMRRDGTEDRRLTARTSGHGLSWSPEGALVAFDETNVVRKFESGSDLYLVDTRNGRRRRLTRGLRASEPDFAPDPKNQALVFVQRFADRSELSILDVAKRITRVVTHSGAGVEWSQPRYSPSGTTIVASRIVAGFSDLALVDPETGVVNELTHDRALDVEPAWIDDATIVFRSDREASSFRLFVAGVDGSLRRLEQGPENAFWPEVDSRRRALFFSIYSALGYDIAVSPFAPGAAAAQFDDLFPENRTEPPPYDGPSRPYSAFTRMSPQFFTPYMERVSQEWRFGLATAAFDPLFRTAFGGALSLGTGSSRPNALGYLRYDRFTPTFSLLLRTESSPLEDERKISSEAQGALDWPLERSVLRTQTLSLIAKRKRVRTPFAFDTGAVAAVWAFDSTKEFARSVSPEGGVRARVSSTRETKVLGSSLDFSKIVIDTRAYVRAGPIVLASRAGAAWALGEHAPQNAFEVGGTMSPSLLDPVGDQPALLRGYDAASATDVSRFGSRLAFANLEARFPLAYPQRGYRALPFFVRRVHASVSVDAAAVSRRAIRLGSARVGLSAGIGLDLFLAHRLPLTLVGGIGHGLTRDGKTAPWFTVGLPF